MAARMAEFVYWLVLGSQLSSVTLRRGDVCGDGPGEWLGEYVNCLWDVAPLPLKLYFRLQGELGLELRCPIQLSSVTLVRGEVEGEWRGDPPVAQPSPGRARVEPLGDTEGDCHGEFWGEFS